MMDPETFDKIEILARKIRKNENSFGGIQIILSGDFFQLSPIKSTDFCFESFTWDNIEKTFYFDKIIRQKDEKLQNILNKIRVGIVDEDVKMALDQCLHKELELKDGIIPTLLFARKNMVNEYNEQELNKLISNGKVWYPYESSYNYGKTKNNEKLSIETIQFYKDLLNSQYQIEDNIILALHSQVMLTINIMDDGLANGSRGIIIDFTKDDIYPYPIVLFLDGKTKVIKPHEYHIDEGGNIIKKFQIPLILSWAITIHKAQGMSLEMVRTDIGNSIFEYGQAYVVLSRIKNLSGLSLINIDYNKIKANPKVIKYYEKLK